MFAEGSGLPRLAMFLFLQLSCICGVHPVFERYMQEPLQAHLAAGGTTGARWHTLVAAVGGLAIAAIAVTTTFGIALLGPTSIHDRMSHCVTVAGQHSPATRLLQRGSNTGRRTGTREGAAETGCLPRPRRHPLRLPSAPLRNMSRLARGRNA